MRAVIQRASGATVSVDGKEISGFTGAGVLSYYWVLPMVTDKKK